VEVDSRPELVPATLNVESVNVKALQLNNNLATEVTAVIGLSGLPGVSVL